MNSNTLASHPQPVSSYSEAVTRLQALQAKDPLDLNPVCRLKFMTHGAKVERTILFLHGFTNCPQQFHILGETFYNQGYNVLIARFPHHGLQDRLTKDQARMTAEELAGLVDEVVDIAHGLGDHITLVGLSGGGVMTGWGAQHRADLHQAVLISPGFGLYVVPPPLTSLAMFLALILPNFFLWWDSTIKADLKPEHAYPWFASHALAQVIRLGQAVLSAARQSKPAAQSILVVTNANDQSVSNLVTEEVVNRWRSQGAKQLHTYEFAADLKLGHDFIEPDESEQQTKVIYPKLVELITN